jgi:quinol-cytochrome oxidoreductase complex cytochrome b subunit
MRRKISADGLERQHTFHLLGTQVAIVSDAKFPFLFQSDPERTVDAILIIGILLLLVALLGVGGVIGALGEIAWILLVIAIIVIAWRVITGRRPV